MTRAHFYTGQALYVRSARQTARTIEVRAVLRHCVPNQGLTSCNAYLDAPDKSGGRRAQHIHIKHDGMGFIPLNAVMKEETA